jgi:TPR repeat protein
MNRSLIRLALPLAALLALTPPALAQSSTLAPTFEEAAALYSDENYSAAYEIAAPLATGGNVDAMIMLAEMYEQGLGPTGDMANAIQWYDTAAAAGNIPAMFRLGMIYLRGNGTKANPAKGARLLRASRQGWQHAGRQRAGPHVLSGQRRRAERRRSHQAHP